MKPQKALSEIWKIRDSEDDEEKRLRSTGDQETDPKFSESGCEVGTFAAAPVVAALSFDRLI